MAEPIQLRCARAYPEQIQKVREWFQKLEEVMDGDGNSDSEYGEWLRKHYHEVEGEWERILFGYETMFDNACDPNLTYLAFKPEILEKLENVEALMKFRSAIQDFMLSRLVIECDDIGEVEAKYPQLTQALREVGASLQKKSSVGSQIDDANNVAVAPV